MKDSTAIFIFVLVVGVMVVGSIFVLPGPNQDNGQESVYVKSVFGCVPLKDKYTPAQWDAKQDLNEKVFGYRLVRCDNG
jgi:hypothetical protein